MRRGGLALAVAEAILGTIRARYRAGVIEHSLARLQQLYRRFEGGEISLGFFAQELGLGVRDLYAALERRGLPTANIGARQPTTGG